MARKLFKGKKSKSANPWYYHEFAEGQIWSAEIKSGIVEHCLCYKAGMKYWGSVKCSYTIKRGNKITSVKNCLKTKSWIKLGIYGNSLRVKVRRCLKPECPVCFCYATAFLHSSNILIKEKYVFQYLKYMLCWLLMYLGLNKILVLKMNHIVLILKCTCRILNFKIF